MIKLAEELKKKFNKLIKEQMIKDAKAIVDKKIKSLIKQGKLEEAKKYLASLNEGVFFSDPDEFDKMITQYSNLFSDDDESLKNRKTTIDKLNKDIPEVNGAAKTTSEPTIKKDKLTAGGQIF